MHSRPKNRPDCVSCAIDITRTARVSRHMIWRTCTLCVGFSTLVASPERESSVPTTPMAGMALVDRAETKLGRAVVLAECLRSWRMSLPLGRRRSVTALDQHVEDVALLVNRAPEIIHRPIDLEEDLIGTLRVARLGPAPAWCRRDLLRKRAAAGADGLPTDLSPCRTIISSAAQKLNGRRMYRSSIQTVATDP